MGAASVGASRVGSFDDALKVEVVINKWVLLALVMVVVMVV